MKLHWFIFIENFRPYLIAIFGTILTIIHINVFRGWNIAATERENGEWQAEETKAGESSCGQ